jgi:hypothetical protein
MLQGDEAMAKATLERLEPIALGVVDEDNHSGPAANRL